MFVKKQEFDKLNAKLDKLEKNQEHLQDTLEFLCHHDRDDIIADTRAYVDDAEYWYQNGVFDTLKLSYINSKGLLQFTKTHLKPFMRLKSVEKVDGDDAIYVLHLKDTTTDNEFNCGDKFIQLNKVTNEIIDITKIKSRYENQEKVSANLKESAQALGEAFKGIFGSCTKNECKCKKSSADKTKKQETAPKTKSRKNTKKEEK